MEKLVIIPDNVCCDRILVKVDGGILRDVIFEGGCDGNGKALGRLLKGMPADRVVEMLKGVDCEGKGHFVRRPVGARPQGKPGPDSRNGCMNRGKHKRLRQRKVIKGFDSHRKRGTAGASAKGRIFGVFRTRWHYVDPGAPHFRPTARTPALPGKHLRAVVSPPMAPHCTD